MIELVTTRWDILDHLKSDEDCRLYLEACFAEAPDDPAFLAKALSDVARARAAVDRSVETDQNPSFVAAVQLLKSLGLHLQAAPASR